MYTLDCVQPCEYCICLIVFNLVNTECHLSFVAISYVDPVYQTSLRVNATNLMLGYNSSIDWEARDRALDVLVPLLELDSPRMASRLGGREGIDEKRRIRIALFDSLYPILTTNIGRSDASVLATQLLRELSRAGEDNREGFLSMQGCLVELASREARVSQLVWNDLYPVPPEPLEENDPMLLDDNIGLNAGLSQG
jgi:hypothetical protein